MKTMVSNALLKAKNIWFEIWFQDKDTIPLEVVRMGVGFLLFFNHIMYAPSDVLALYGDSGLFPLSVVPWISNLGSFSLFVFLEQDWQVLTFHYVFVALSFCLFVGWKTAWVKWLVLIIHMSYFNRNEFLIYGVDRILIAFLMLLCLAPVGSALSLDRIKKVRKYKQEHGLAARPPLPTSQIAFACQRLMQFQMAVVFFISGANKLEGSYWWDGTAPWIAFNNYEVAFFPVGLFADNFWIINLMAFGTVFVEIAYAFLIWGHKTRPYLLVSAILLHIGIMVFMGMYYFAAAMIFGHLAFMRRSWYRSFGAWWKAKMGNMEMIYDGQCGFCIRAMCTFLAYDGLSQIKVRDYRTDPSPIVESEKVDKALYLVNQNEDAIPGFDAYRYAVLRVPGMWWQVPLFYVPIFSRLVGRPLYNWIAQNRAKISQCVIN